MEDALPLESEEGRAKLRKAAGSCQGSEEPQMSEWGNPAGEEACHPAMNP